MFDHFQVEIRDLKDGVPFCSITRNGFVSRFGATLLKHQFIPNPCTEVGQCKFLPFRDSREFMVRAAWSRETKPRDGVDVAMSVMGQAYATYASNDDAYLRLRLLYEEIIYGMSDIDTLQEKMQNRLGHDEIKKLRQAAITPEEFIQGFPEWSTLVKKNILDKSYQETSILPLDIGGPLEVDEFDFF